MRTLSIFSIISILVLAGCLSFPQNVKEFMDHAGTDQESFTQKPIASVVTKNSKLFMKCFDATYTLRPAGYALGSGTKIVFTPKIFKEDEVVFFTLQKEGGSLAAGAPENGMYIFSAKVEKISAEKTKITTSAYYMDENIETTFHEWSADKTEECPNLL
ncbi:MAG: hypothetical protein ABFS32_18900 [Bacteroidota bacterium]